MRTMLAELVQSKAALSEEQLESVLSCRILGKQTIKFRAYHC